jgi:hypothetical protein
MERAGKNGGSLGARGCVGGSHREEHSTNKRFMSSRCRLARCDLLNRKGGRSLPRSLSNSSELGALDARPAFCRRLRTLDCRM